MSNNPQLVDDKPKKVKKKGIVKKIVISLWTVFAIGLLSTVLIFVLIANGKIGYMPPIEYLENPIDKYASQVYSSDGVTVGTFSLDKNNRIYSSYSDLSPYLVQALVATEDARYYDHSGIDIYALSRAIIKTGILRQKTGGGGSTISQQVAKQLFSPKADNKIERILQKPIEWVIASKLERYYTKDEIINLYLNQFDFLYNAVGIQSAAKVYFNKQPKELKIEEAATLIGMCKNPAYFNPIRHNERTKGRRNTVFEQMYKAKLVTQQQLDSLKKLPLKLDFKRADHKAGLAPYFREFLRLSLGAKEPIRSNYASWQAEQFARDSMQWATNPFYGWCNKNKKSDGAYYNLATDGLKIYTTIDSRMQRYAEEAVVEQMSENLQPIFDNEKKGRPWAPYSSQVAKQVDSFLKRAMRVTDRYRELKKQKVSDSEIMKIFKTPVEMKVFSWKGEIDTTMTPLDSIRYHKGFLRTGFVAMDTYTGYVRAYVGEIDYKYFKYDMATLGRRQVGSTIKPYLYSLAMEEGMTPCDEMLHVEQVLTDESGREWRPRNASARRIGEVVTIKWGLENSDNWVTAYVMKHTSPYTFARMLHSFGITGYIDPVISMSLGTHDVSVAEMAAAYTAFANKGIRANPVYVTHIEDSHGNVLATFTPKLVEVFSERTYVKMLDMLRGVIDQGSGGRVRRIYKIEGPMGGKTGTTQNNSDGWFMGFSPRLSAACWVGGEDRSIHFDNLRNGQGAATALPIFGLFMQKIYADPDIEYKPTDKFETVDGMRPCDRSEDSEIVDNTIEIDQSFN